MAKKSKKAAELKQTETRHDIVTGRMSEDSYIAKIDRPVLAIRGSGIDLKRLTQAYGVEDVRPSNKKVK